jgi:cytochrome P450
MSPAVITSPTTHKPSDPAAAGQAPLRQLADLPGPKPWPLVGNSLQVNLPQLHLDLERWLNEYGSMLRLRLGRMELMVVADHAISTHLLRDRPDGFRRPSQLEEVMVEIGVKRGVFLAEGASWANQRRMVMASFSPTHVRGYFPQLLRVTERLKGRWLKSAGQSLDLQAELMRFTVDAIAGLAFGQDINTLESDDDIIQQHLDKIFPAIWRRTNALIPYWRYVKLPVDRELDRSVKVVNQAIDGFVKEARVRLKDTERRARPQNLLEAMLVAADEPGSGVTDDDVAGNVFTMLLAGEDTTATSLSWMLYLLSRDPAALQKAVDEVDHVMGRVTGSADDLSSWTPEKMAELDYIEACTHEAMRLKPVGPFNAVEALKDTVVGDVAVPKGTLVFMVLRHDNLNETYFPDAKAFQPERWLSPSEGEAPGTVGNAKRVSMPFGAGPRVCPGRYLALLEIKMAMAMLLQNFELLGVDTPDGGEAQELMSFTMVPVGLRIRLRKRPMAVQA